MRYERMCAGIFLSRPNRFIARVLIDGVEQTVHVKNTGRCKELLIPGVRVFCQLAKDPARKTQSDLISAVKNGKLINMDSQAPNIVAGEWLRAGGLGEIENLRAETVHADSRFDFSFQKDGRQCFLEVKGVTLETNGICAFPDAPTERGTKHLRGLMRSVSEGYEAYALFVIQMEDALSVQPNDSTDPAFGAALREAASAGVHVMAVRCTVREDSMEISGVVPVIM